MRRSGAGSGASLRCSGVPGPPSWRLPLSGPAGTGRPIQRSSLPLPASFFIPMTNTIPSKVAATPFPSGSPAGGGAELELNSGLSKQTRRAQASTPRVQFSNGFFHRVVVPAKSSGVGAPTPLNPFPAPIAECPAGCVASSRHPAAHCAYLFRLRRQSCPFVRRAAWPCGVVRLHTWPRKDLLGQVFLDGHCESFDNFS